MTASYGERKQAGSAMMKNDEKDEKDANQQLLLLKTEREKEI